MEIIKFKKIDKGALKATLSIKIPKWGNFIIHDIAYFETNGKRWITFPSKEYEKDGKKQYFAYNQFEDRAIGEAFKNKVIEAIDAYIPTPSSDAYYKNLEQDLF